MQLLALELLRELRRGYPTALLAERGIPLLQMQQTLQLTQLYYRLRVSAPSTAITFYKDIGAEGEGMPEGVLGQCSSLAELDLRSVDIGEDPHGTVARLRSSTRDNSAS